MLTLNAPAPILVTLLGIVIVVMLVHKENAWAPILSTPFCSVTLFNERQYPNAFSPIDLTQEGISIVSNLELNKKVLSQISVTL